MNILMKSIGMWLLILWNKENNWVRCADNGPESYNLLPENDNTKKPPDNDLDELFLHVNNTDKLPNTTDRIKFEGVSSTLTTEKNRPLENSTNKLLNNKGQIKFEGVNSTAITEKNTPVENIVNMEGGGSVIPVHPNSPQGLRSREHVASFSSKDLPVNGQSNPPQSSEKPKIFPRKGVNESTENSSSMENSDEISTDVDVPHKICFCCPNNTLRNESDINCSKCCDSVKDVGNTSSTANNISNTTPLGNPLPTESIPPAVINVTVHDSINQDTSNFVNQDKHNSTSANSTDPSMGPPKRNKKPQFTLDASNDSSANLSSQPLSHNDSNKTDYVIPVVGAILAVPLAVVLAMFLYKKGSELWERRHYRRMDFLIDGMYND